MKTYELTQEEADALRAGDSFVLHRPQDSIRNFMKGTRCILNGLTLVVSSFNKADMPGDHFRVVRNPHDFEMKDKEEGGDYWKRMNRGEVSPRADRLELKRIRVRSVDAGDPAKHQGLVECAAKWLAGTRRCPVVVREQYSNCDEFPDAMGFLITGGNVVSITVECKASRADFLNDRKKAHRFHVEYTAKGDFRFYLVGEAVAVDLSEIPEGWGLLRIKEGRVRVVRDAVRQDRTPESMREEVAFLFAVIRRSMFEGPGFIVSSVPDRPEFRKVTPPADGGEG